jgi:hypothetical protein
MSEANSHRKNASRRIAAAAECKQYPPQQNHRAETQRARGNHPTATPVAQSLLTVRLNNANARTYPRTNLARRKTFRAKENDDVGFFKRRCRARLLGNVL